MLFWLCEGIILGVSSALSAANLRDHFPLVLEVGCGDEELCTRAQDLRHCLASAALTSGGINAFPLQQEENCCLLFCKGAWRDELPEAAPEACDEAGNNLTELLSLSFLPRLTSEINAGVCSALHTLISKCLLG